MVPCTVFSSMVIGYHLVCPIHTSHKFIILAFNLHPFGFSFVSIISAVFVGLIWTLHSVYHFILIAELALYATKQIHFFQIFLCFLQVTLKSYYSWGKYQAWNNLLFHVPWYLTLRFIHVGVCDVTFSEHLWLTLETFVQDNQTYWSVMKRLLACTWAELRYQLDVIRATRVPMLRWTKAHINFLQVQNIF
jgi:hypothetical protein